MRILCVNDDGINAEGLRILATWAQKLGEVTVCAPKLEQSGKSHSINIITPFEVKRVDTIPGAECYSVDSTPADCVRFGVIGLGREYDLVFSGINRGFNLGDDIFYSGTYGAATEAFSLGLSTVAMSTDAHSFSEAEKKLDEVYAFIRDNGLLDVHKAYSVNIPLDSQGIRVTRQGGPDYKDIFVKTGEDMYFQQGYSAVEFTQNPELDIDAVLDYRYISVMPMTMARYSKTAFEKLRYLNEK